MTNKDQSREAVEPTSGSWINADDVNRLTRELDSLLHGGEDAAKQASLCDLVGIVKCAVEKRGSPLLAAPAAPVELPEPAGEVMSAQLDYACIRWLSQTSAVGGGDPGNSYSWPLAGTKVFTEQQVRELLAAAPKLPEGDGWLPIESAPKNQLVMVYSPPQNDDHPEAIRIVFDYIDAGIADGYWYAHGESYEHFCCVAKPEGCTGPSEKAPYTHWMALPQPPQERGTKGER